MNSNTPFWQYALILPFLMNAVLFAIFGLGIVCVFITQGPDFISQLLHDRIIDNSFYGLRVAAAIEVIICVAGLLYGWDLYNDPPSAGEL